MEKRSLGKGLAALLNEENKELIAEEKKNILKDIPIKHIIPNPNQPRTVFNEEEIAELAASIKSVGVLEPLIVQKKENKYVIVAGERRWRACKLAKLEKIPVIIKNDIGDNLMEIMLIENIQRSDLTPIEEAKAFQEIINKKNITQEQLANFVGKSRTSITNAIRILDLPNYIQEKINEKKISIGHAKMLAGIKNESILKKFYEKIINEKITVNSLEGLIKNENSRQKERKIKNPYLEEMEENLSIALKTKTTIFPIKKNIGKIEIEYYDEEGLEEICRSIKK